MYWVIEVNIDGAFSASRVMVLLYAYCYDVIKCCLKRNAYVIKPLLFPLFLYIFAVAYIFSIHFFLVGKSGWTVVFIINIILLTVLQVDECTYRQGQMIHGGGVGGAHYSQIAFFCGMHHDCNFFESERALRRAKANVDKHYAVVAVLEQLEKSLQVLEEFIPRYFANARQAYRQLLQERRHGVNVNLYKPKNFKSVRNMLLSNFTKEIEFYEFCKAKLHKQYLTIA